MNKVIINCLPRMNVLSGYYSLRVIMPPRNKINSSWSLSPHFLPNLQDRKLFLPCHGEKANPDLNK